jgi:hypothetical protein
VISSHSCRSARSHALAVTVQDACHSAVANELPREETGGRLVPSVGSARLSDGMPQLDAARCSPRGHGVWAGYRALRRVLDDALESILPRKWGLHQPRGGSVASLSYDSAAARLPLRRVPARISGDHLSVTP